MTDECEYVSNPRLRVLAEELRILNDILIKRRLPDRIRLFQLRDFAQASKHITGVKLPTLTLLGEDIDNPRWTTTIDGKSIGEYSTPTQAIEAYKRAHVERFGLDSQYHPDRPIDDSYLYEPDDLPKGVAITGDGRYKVTIGLNGKQTYLGIFNDLESATEAIHNARSGLITSQPETPMPTGVRMSPSGRFVARIKTGKGDNKVEKHLGTFKTPEAAHDAYKRAHVEHYGNASPYYESMKEAA